MSEQNDAANEGRMGNAMNLDRLDDGQVQRSRFTSIYFAMALAGPVGGSCNLKAEVTGNRGSERS